ncbi:hypothetical protein BC938DRAFT_483649, partial [Jimgerdemannia flammicorona]
MASNEDHYPNQRSRAGPSPPLNTHVRSYTTNDPEAGTSPVTPTSAGTKPRRQKSLVRPERERVDPNHPQYYYRQRAESLDPDQVAQSTTGHAPMVGPDGRPLSDPSSRYPSLRRAGVTPTPNNSPVPPADGVRRGKSILGREEPGMHRGRTLRDRPPGAASHARPAVTKEGTTNHAIAKSSTGPKPVVAKKKEDGPTLWIVFCHVMTACFPAPVLSTIGGLKTQPAQRAWREKMGLVIIILLICGAVGFLTFGFTQSVCPAPPLRFRIGTINRGSLIINGYAYQLSDWNNHPPITGMSNESSNPLYPPLNAGGLDASFLFQKVNGRCLNVIVPKPGVDVHQQGESVPTYFPCRTFNPNKTVAPDPSTYFNYTGCHLSGVARASYYGLMVNGVQNAKGKWIKGAQVYYDWDDVNRTTHLAVYNGLGESHYVLDRHVITTLSPPLSTPSDVLNLDLLSSLRRDLFNVPMGGLIETLTSADGAKTYGGADLSHHVVRMGQKLEAECLTDIIKVGTMDTESIGCIASDIVLYVSLAVILGVIVIKFLLAIIFGWFLSWKLGNFNEGISYSAKMRRANEIEHWTEEIHQPAEAINPRPYAPAGGWSKKKSKLLPQTSRFTQPEPGKNFNASEWPQNTFTKPTQ